MPFLRLLTLGGVVIWPLLVFSVLATVLILERCWFWGRLLPRQEQLITAVLKAYPQNPQVALSKLKQNTDLPLARIFLSALSLAQATPEEFRLALETAAQAELPLLKRFNTVFDTIIGVAPLLGLLGTVLGLIEAFASLRLGDVGGVESVGVTSGIGEALISTAAGLIVAIATLLFANLFQGFYRRQRTFIQAAAGRLEILHRRLYRQQLQPPKDRYGEVY
ncbi:MAG: MotA/TolQ/ExbB proton channel family protein [Leptolyngbyaceae cyanobacterium SM1_1_3]|nr:MotA/TolQ/ExbB proton channel family protein [Leptolyngbyaceae cyanobacterium SM1_1_3]NJN04406.1 MotA/TolQ/ExbB proton channel family protein [Leptolyngbyaceae cyanobacterium RM1_1_2]NJO11893.1 MotA/TolQ/ExbB proton channel family protein [Leptolyngbyaceae cyanobacterium SL_1_1]